VQNVADLRVATTEVLRSESDDERADVVTTALEVIEEQLAHVDDELELLAKRDPLVRLCATAPGPHPS
jgi:hypothetical protein